MPAPITDYIITPAPIPDLPVRGTSALFPVRRVYCIGRNYAAHTIEMGGDPVREIGHPDKGAIQLMVNDEERQSGDLDQMIWKVPEMISYLSDYFELAAGDIIMSGTPSGVGPVQRGDRMHAVVAGIGALEVVVV